MIIPGTIVKIQNLSKRSYHLYKHYEKDSPLIICPCKVRRNILLVVEDIFDGKQILSPRNGQKFLTVTYLSDLVSVFERMDPEGLEPSIG